MRQSCDWRTGLYLAVIDESLAVIDESLDFGHPPWREVVARITCPVLLITADPERGGIVTPEAAEEATRLWRTGRVVHIPGPTPSTWTTYR